MTTRYFGKHCLKHPEFLGERLSSNRCCVKCSQEKVAAYRKSEKRKPREKELRAKHYIKNCAAIKEKVAKYRKIKLNDGSLLRTKENLRRRIRLAFEKAGYPQKSNTAQLLGCDWATLKTHIEAMFYGGMTWENRGQWHLDHKIPLCTATTEAELIRLNHYTNLQPLWAKDNLRKNKYIV